MLEKDIGQFWAGNAIMKGKDVRGCGRLQMAVRDQRLAARVTPLSPLSRSLDHPHSQQIRERSWRTHKNSSTLRGWNGFVLPFIHCSRVVKMLQICSQMVEESMSTTNQLFWRRDERESASSCQLMLINNEACWTFKWPSFTAQNTHNSGTVFVQFSSHFRLFFYIICRMGSFIFIWYKI